MLTDEYLFWFSLNISLGFFCAFCTLGKFDVLSIETVEDDDRIQLLDPTLKKTYKGDLSVSTWISKFNPTNEFVPAIKVKNA